MRVQWGLRWRIISTTFFALFAAFFFPWNVFLFCAILHSSHYISGISKKWNGTIRCISSWRKNTRAKTPHKNNKEAAKVNLLLAITKQLTIFAPSNSSPGTSDFCSFAKSYYSPEETYKNHGKSLQCDKRWQSWKRKIPPFHLSSSEVS